MSPPRTAASWMVRNAASVSPSLGRRARWAEASPRMAPRTLFMSWATPLASTPRLSS